MAEQDLYINQMIADKDCFADLCNGILFHGRQIIKPQDLTLITGRSGIQTADDAGLKKTLQRQRDVTMCAKNNIILAVIAAENQAGVHYAMAVRSMLYDALDYTMQVQNICDKRRKTHEKMDSAGFLSGISKDDRLIPVITMVLYYGKDPWDGCQSLHELLDLEHAAGEMLELKPYIPDYKINLIQACRMEDITRFQTHLQYIFGMLKYNTDKEALYKYVRDNRTALLQMSSNAKMALLSLIGEQKRLARLTENFQNMEDFDMCKAIDDLIADGVAEGVERGKELGKEIGKTIGEDRLSTLINTLINDNRLDLVRAVTSDPEIRRQLYKRYQL